MYAVGAIEILAGVVVAVSLAFGGYLVAAWLGGIVVNLLTADPPRYYDVALRDFGLALGALALARLATGVRAAGLDRLTAAQRGASSSSCPGTGVACSSASASGASSGR